MTLEHNCRIVKEAQRPQSSGWALYWDGAYCDNFASTQLARAAGLSLCAPARAQITVVISVEDASGRRLSTERLVRQPVTTMSMY
jgi:hypothetical protein